MNQVVLHRLIDSIDTESLHEQWLQISDTAVSWWQQLLQWLAELWAAFLSLF